MRDGRAHQNVVHPGSDDGHEVHYREHGPQVGEPADDGVVLSLATDQTRDRRTHVPHGPYHDRKAEQRRGHQQQIDRRRVRSPTHQYRATETCQAPERGEQNGEPAQLPRRGVGERQEPLLPAAARKQELGEEPRDPHGDDRDQQLQYRDPAQAVPLPEREEYREKRQREHCNPDKIQDKTGCKSECTGREGLHRRRHEPPAIMPQHEIVYALRKPGDHQRPDQKNTDER